MYSVVLSRPVHNSRNLVVRFDREVLDTAFTQGWARVLAGRYDQRVGHFSEVAIGLRDKQGRYLDFVANR